MPRIEVDNLSFYYRRTRQRRAMVLDVSHAA